MAFFEFKNVKIAGVAAAVPAKILVNDTVSSTDYEAEDFVALTGVRQRRDGNFTTSDLCYEATERLIQDLGWQKEDIDALLFVSQTPDYILPATSCILQDRLGLSKECYAADISLGCSGWTYGLSLAAGLLSNNGMKKALLLVGDAKPRSIPFYSDPLFGHAGTVTAIEYRDGEPGFQFHAGTDGSGYEAIIIKEGGSRFPFNENSLKFVKSDDGICKHAIDCSMNGMDVFAFGITTAPKSVKKLMEKNNIAFDQVDYFIFHQANKMMNEKIRTKLKLDESKVPYCMQDFGNTSSASIPLTIVTQLAESMRNRQVKIIACGFGVGLSWGTVYFETDKIVCSELIEI